MNRLKLLALSSTIILIALGVVLTLYYQHYRHHPMTKIPQKKEKFVLAFYYPWYGSRYGPTHAWRHWNHWRKNVITGEIIEWHNPDEIIRNDRRDIGAAHYPILGPYDSFDENTIVTHFKWARSAGIDVFICSWWGVGSYEDLVFKKMLEIATKYNYPIKLTIYYESVGLTRNRGPEEVAKDIMYIIKNYASYDNFFKYNGSPVIFVYAVEVKPYFYWKAVIDKLRQYNMSCMLIADTTSEMYAKIFSGIHIYNPLSLLLSDPTGNLLNYTYEWMNNITKRNNLLFVATVLPGYNDTMVRYPGHVLNRDGGKTYNLTWKIALVNKPDWIVITSWNEWHEGSEIEPSLEYGYKYLNLTAYWVKKFKEG